MREINLETIRSAPGDDQHILRDHRNPLGTLQEKQGNHHWLRMFLPLSPEMLMTVYQVMRQVLPDIHWETY